MSQIKPELLAKLDEIDANSGDEYPPFGRVIATQEVRELLGVAKSDEGAGPFVRVTCPLCGVQHEGTHRCSESNLAEIKSNPDASRAQTDACGARVQNGSAICGRPRADLTHTGSAGGRYDHDFLGAAKSSFDEKQVQWLRDMAERKIHEAEYANEYWHKYQKMKEPWKTHTTDREGHSQTLYEWRAVINATDEIERLRAEVEHYEEIVSLETVAYVKACKPVSGNG